MSGQAYTDHSPVERRGISASEKYSELEELGLRRPHCDCHGEMMIWGKSSRVPAGGYWRCALANRRYSKSHHEANREHILDRMRRNNLRIRSTAGKCSTATCDNERRLFSTGKYHTQCDGCRSRERSRYYWGTELANRIEYDFTNHRPLLVVQLEEINKELMGLDARR